MTILIRQISDDGFSFFTNDGRQLITHTANNDCYENGCCMHNPTLDWTLVNAPYNWREDRGIMERICEHGVGHPDIDSAHYLERIGHPEENIHGCDGCCVDGSGK